MWSSPPGYIQHVGSLLSVSSIWRSAELTPRLDYTIPQLYSSDLLNSHFTLGQACHVDVVWVTDILPEPCAREILGMVVLAEHGLGYL